jgi:DDB1- and CUL4-associated factor 11
VLQGGVSGYDYRWSSYPYAECAVRRDADASLLALRGHDVASTLIRAHWSPLATTGGRYVYSGSACGKVFIFDALTGHVAHELEGARGTVRDVAWHPTQPRLVCVSWDGTIREWRGGGGGGEPPSAPVAA